MSGSAGDDSADSSWCSCRRAAADQPGGAVLHDRARRGAPDGRGAVQALWDDMLVDDVIGAPGAVAWLVAVSPPLLRTTGRGRRGG